MASLKKALQGSYGTFCRTEWQNIVEGIQGEISEISINQEEEGKYSITLTTQIDDVQNVSLEEIVKRVFELGADLERGWM